MSAQISTFLNLVGSRWLMNKLSPIYRVMVKFRSIVKCTFGSGVKKSIAISVSQMILVVFSDLLRELYELYNVFNLSTISLKTFKFYTSHVALSGKSKLDGLKIALLSSLRLTILTIMCTITRISGIHTAISIDSGRHTGNSSLRI